MPHHAAKVYDNSNFMTAKPTDIFEKIFLSINSQAKNPFIQSPEDLKNSKNMLSCEVEVHVDKNNITQCILVIVNGTVFLCYKENYANLMILPFPIQQITHF